MAAIRFNRPFAEVIFKQRPKKGELDDVALKIIL